MSVQVFDARSSPQLQTKTITPSASTQHVTPSTGYDGLSQVIINGDSNLISQNIKSGVSIFGVTGTFTGGLQQISTNLTWNFSDENLTSSNLLHYGTVWGADLNKNIPYSFSSTYYPKLTRISWSLYNPATYTVLSFIAIWSEISWDGSQLTGQHAGDISGDSGTTLYYGLTCDIGYYTREYPMTSIHISYMIPKSMYSYLNSFSNVTREAQLVFYI